MKYQVLLLLNFCNAQFLIAQAPYKAPATLIIIGVSHTETKFMNSDSLLGILKKIKPDLILDEMQSPSGYYTKEKIFRNLPLSFRVRNMLGISQKLPLEKKVLYDYKNIDPAILIKPFDVFIEDRNKYIKEDNNWEKAFFGILNNPDNHFFFLIIKSNNFKSMYHLTTLCPISFKKVITI